MTPTPPFLQNTAPVVKAFGYWPSFHDAPVVAFRYDRGAYGAVEFTLHGWEMTAEVDERGFFKLIKHQLVRFSFHGITDADLDRFTSMGNILFALGFSSPEEFAATGKFSVNLDSAMGGDLCGSFSAHSGEVMEVVPCDGEGRRTEPGASPNCGPTGSVASSEIMKGPQSATVRQNGPDMRASILLILVVASGLLLSLWLLQDAMTFALHAADSSTGRLRGCYTSIELLLPLKTPSGWVRPMELVVGGITLLGSIIAITGIFPRTSTQ